jgi:UDP-glucose 4-epimerase
VPFYQGNIGDGELIARIASEHDLESSIHFAALAYVGESVTEPARYFENNVRQGVVLLDSLLKAGVRRLVFSQRLRSYRKSRRASRSGTTFDPERAGMRGGTTTRSFSFW